MDSDRSSRRPRTSPKSPCIGYDRYHCNNGERLLVCQYASGPKRSFCRKITSKRKSRLTPIVARSEKRVKSKALQRISREISKRRALERGKELAATRISKATKYMLQRRASSSNTKVSKKKKRVSMNALSPMSKHYKEVSEKDREQPSIYLFRQRCKLFPHPVEFFSPDGLKIPMGRNFAVDFKNNDFWPTVPQRVEEFVPALLDHQHIYKYESSVLGKAVSPTDVQAKLPKRLYTHDNDVIIGVKYVTVAPGMGDGAHLVFFEVRMNKNDDGPHAMVLDPNGRDDARFHKDLRHFFDGIPYEVATTNYINRGDTNNEKVQKAMMSLGFKGTDDMWTGGYCATVACFFLIDYICTNQWDARNSDHFVRSSQEWLMSPQENKTGYFSLDATDLRVILFARYIAFKVFKLMHPKITVRRLKDVKMRKVIFQHRFTGNNSLESTISVGTSKVRFLDEHPRPMSMFESVFLKGVPKKLF